MEISKYKTRKLTNGLLYSVNRKELSEIMDKKKKFEYFEIGDAKEINSKDLKILKKHINNLTKKGHAITTNKKNKRR